MLFRSVEGSVRSRRRRRLAFAHTYSFYPLGNVFEGYIILTTGAQGAVSFSWIEPILRLLAVPSIVFALGRRLFSTRIAVLGLFFYLGTGSILFNIPVQQGIGIIFVGLSLLALIMLTRSAEETSQRRAQILFALVSGGIVMTHHLSSYIFAGWLATLAIMMSTRRFRPVVGSLRLGVLFLYFIALLAIYITFFTYAILRANRRTSTSSSSGSSPRKICRSRVRVRAWAGPSRSRKSCG